MQISTTSGLDPESAKALLSAANHAPYAIAPVAEEKLFRPGYPGCAEIVVARTGGTLDGLAVRCGGHIRLLAVHPERQRRGIGSALLERCERDAAANGELSVIIGAEPGNYFTPGVSTTDIDSIEFFIQRGYRQTEEAVNLLAPLIDNEKLETERAGAPGSIRRAEQSDRSRASEFIERQFGRIWRHEASFAFEHDPPTMFLAEEYGHLVGFSAHEANNAGLGTFGPTGVAAMSRGKGFGAGLLLASLRDLRAMGFERAIIAWAAAQDFYAAVCGAVPADRFVGLRKDSSSDG